MLEDLTRGVAIVGDMIFQSQQIQNVIKKDEQKFIQIKHEYRPSSVTLWRAHVKIS